MRWRRVRGAGDIEDRRGRGGMGGGPVGVPIPMGRAGGGLGMVLLLVVILLLGGNQVLGDGSGGIAPGLEPAPEAAAPGAAPAGDTALEFTKFVSQDAQDFWAQRFAASGKSYRRAPVVIFSSGTTSRCGPASSATGPFYCPADGKIYLDLSFFRELSRRFGAPGDFAAAYVIAHEVGHHLQNVLGIEQEVRRKQADDPANANGYLVQLELQADCLAGVWAHSTYERGLLEDGDLEEGLTAARAVGDDRLGARSPEQWTHGSSALREEWFRTGFDSGDPGRCDTSGVDV